MTKVTMPDPVVEVDKHAVSSELQYTYLAPSGGLEHGTELITTDQAEAYKDACVREALFWRGDPVSVINELRFALGDNGQRSIPELIEHARELAACVALAQEKL